MATYHNLVPTVFPAFSEEVASCSITEDSFSHPIIEAMSQTQGSGHKVTLGARIHENIWMVS